MTTHGQHGTLTRVRARGLTKADCAFVFGCAAHNLLLPGLMALQQD